MEKSQASWLDPLCRYEEVELVNVVDMAACKREYEAADFPVSVICQRHRVTKVVLLAKAQEEKWKRNKKHLVHDWAVIRSAYESSWLSTVVLGNEFDINPSTIQKKAQKDGWLRPD